MSNSTDWTLQPPTAWQASNFAEAWLRDAVEQTLTDDVNARRKEIIFAVCFAESYLFEWARMRLMPTEVNKYFPTDSHDSKYRRSLLKKWVEVPRELASDGIIRERPTLDVSDLWRLVNYRNGLVHAEASRQEPIGGPPIESKAFPTTSDLAELEPGWATGIVVSLVRQLHGQIGEDPPKYVEDQWPGIGGPQ